MKRIFRIETDNVSLEFSSPENILICNEAPHSNHDGRLLIMPGRKYKNSHINIQKICYKPPLKEIVCAYNSTEGPRLFEDVTYNIYIKSKTGDKIKLVHSDPLILQGIDYKDSGLVILGNINFKGQIGHSTFSVFVSDEKEFDFEVEVFPRKINYKDDYKNIISDLENTFKSISLQYLRATFFYGKEIASEEQSNIEWFIILEKIMKKLTQALRHIDKNAHKAFIRKQSPVKSYKITKVSSSLIKEIRQTKGSGGYIRVAGAVKIKNVVTDYCPRVTLNIPEHKWIKNQLIINQRRAAKILSIEKKYLENSRDGYSTVKERKIVQNIENIKNDLQGLLKLEAIAEASGTPPSGFSSVVLQSAPGYSEAYRALLNLSQGLQIVEFYEEILRLSVKDIYVLYEYWSFIAIINLLSEMIKKDIPIHQLLRVNRGGLQIALKKGYKEVVHFRESNRKIHIAYNQLYSGEGFIFKQQPDIVITLINPPWPELTLILDAKYKIKCDKDFIMKFGSPGPPINAVNVLHRYRDAIIRVEDRNGPRYKRFKKIVVEGVALFPYVDKNNNFKKSRFWNSLNELGIGALPFLPGEKRYVKEWLRHILNECGWASSERVIPSILYEKALDWRDKARKIVLVGVLRSGNSGEHLSWILSNKIYYIPYRHSQKRQFVVEWVALYLPAKISGFGFGAVTYKMPIKKIEILKRSEIKTPWPPEHGDPDSLFVLYHLGDIEKIEPPIKNIRGERFSINRWSSILALDRAKKIEELYLETEPEWRLYEELLLRKIDFKIKAASPKLQTNDSTGRCWFSVNKHEIQYRGIKGFYIKDLNLYLQDAGSVIRELKLL